MTGHSWRWAAVTAVLAIAAAVLSVSGAVSSGEPDRHAAHDSASRRAPQASRPARRPAGHPTHVAIIVMENEDYGSVIGSGQAPFITGLARSYGLADEMFATSHPSLPNYLALTAGSTFGISSDCTACSVKASDIATQLQSAGISWKAYMEGLPQPCFTGAGAGGYAKKHDPFLYFIQVADNPALCGHVVPLWQLPADERAGRLPTFIWVTPNLCHDMHDCGVAAGDRFLAGFVPGLLRALGPRGLLFLTWDEGSSDSGCCQAASGGHVATIVAGAGARRGARLTTPTDQYSVLQTVEDLLGLPRLRYAACRCTPSLKPLLDRGLSR